MKTETIVTVADNSKDKFQFEVPSDWLQKVLKDWATEDSKGVEKDVDLYISGRTEHLYENLQDSYFAQEIFELAVADNVVIGSKEVEVTE